MFEINIDELQTKIKEMEAFRSKLKVVIDPFLKDNLPEKKTIELCQAGKFLTLLDEQSRIIQQTESPDFIISLDNSQIGLEHQRIFQLAEVQSFQSISKLFDDAADVFKAEYPEHKILANCWLTDNDFQFTKSESNELKKEIANYIFSLVAKQPYAKPAFIEKVWIMPHSDVAFEYNSGGYISNIIDEATLKGAISKKESLLHKYKEISGLDRQWLLLVIGNLGPHSFKFRDGQSIIESSEFERIYLLEDFDGRIYRLL